MAVLLLRNGSLGSIRPLRSLDQQTLEQLFMPACVTNLWVAALQISSPHARRERRQQCSGSGRSRPACELTVSETFRSFRRQGHLDTDDRSRGTADMARHRRATTKSLERRCARCPGDRPRRPIECPLLTALNSPTRPLAACRAPAEADVRTICSRRKVASMRAGTLPRRSTRYKKKASAHAKALVLCSTATH